jgi:hypothetical protein
MQRFYTLIGCAALLTLGAAAQAQDRWYELFDGHSKSGWKAADHASTWRVADGVLVNNGPTSHLFYVGPVLNADFKNFELEVEAKAAPGANSGVYFHTQFEPGWPSRGFEVQICNTCTGQHGYIERKKTGSLYAVRNVYKQLVADNEWFKLNVLVQGKRVQVRLNGTLLVDYIEPATPATGDEHPGRVISHGTFALQGHDPASHVWIRHVRVRPLSDEAPAVTLPVFDKIDQELIKLGSANYPVVDYHVHLKGGWTMAQALEKSRRDGVFYGIAINGGKGFPVTNDAQLLEAMKVYDGAPVFKAFQGEGREWVDTFSRDVLAKFDYVFTDAMTFTADDGRRLRLWIPEEVGPIADHEKFMDMIVDRIVKIVSTEPIDIYGNATYLPDAMAAEYDKLWTPERMQRVIDAVKQGGAAVEISNRYKIPSVEFVKRAKAAGIKFTCGTNNASNNDMSREEYCVDVIQKAGLQWQDMWVPAAEGQKAVQRMKWH